MKSNFVGWCLGDVSTHALSLFQNPKMYGRYVELDIFC